MAARKKNSAPSQKRYKLFIELCKERADFLNDNNPLILSVIEMMASSDGLRLTMSSSNSQIVVVRRGPSEET